MIMADRYRIIGLLGRGGMGEVYRADDLKLGQAVALKFLPRGLALDPVRREQLFAEVRITRQLSHPNICRVYDIAEYEGQHFLSMEFIDGEDLASLIKRIGYLSNEKALDITRQLVAGLSAAHERGVLHRDLKPANIMLDGHGRVRITDFGIAVAVGDETRASEIAGTPAYMAPEQLAGKAASVRTDIYALGLILYELYCGKKAFTATSVAELRDQKESRAPHLPSEIRQGLDPIVERVIMRCLERDPGARPASAAQLAAALPGGDPLAAAIAAGETPSPEMVAAAGLKEGLRPGVAVLLLAVAIIGVISAAAMNRQTTIIGRVPPAKPPAFLSERARELLTKLGYATESGDSDYGFYYNNEFLAYVTQDRSKNPLDKLADFPPIFFIYRHSPGPLERKIFVNNSSDEDDPSLSISGDVRIKLDTDGRLRDLEAIPPELESQSGVVSPPDWARVFTEAGLDISKWTAVAPERIPLHYSDSRAAWKGVLPMGQDVPVRIEAAAFRGRPVSFEIIGPWTQTRTASLVIPLTPARKIGIGILLAIVFVVIAGAVFFAQRNLRLGRGDRRGATRLALVALAAFTISWLLEEHHVATPWELVLFLMFASKALTQAAILWVLYIALEPLVRRRWPQMLVSWTRLLGGEWRDPLVGRDTLIGCVAGSLTVCLPRIFKILSDVGHEESAYLLQLNIDTLFGPGWLISSFANQVTIGLVFTLGFLFLFLLLRLVLRNDRAAAVALILLVFLPGNVSAAGWVGAIFGLIFGSMLTLVLIRFGLVALFAAFLIPPSFPMTLETSSWYFGISLSAMIVIGVIALYGFKTSLGGRKLINLAAIED
jgi:hypothetical protein